MYLNTLTSLRGVAALSVAQLHFLPYYYQNFDVQNAPILSMAFVAVDLFFCLSGFVLYLNYSRMKSDFNFMQFLQNRVARIFPLHIITAFAMLGMILVTHPIDQAEIHSTFFLNLLLVHSWGLLDDLVFNVPSWSLSVEWALYLMFPIFALALIKIRSPYVLIIAIAAMYSLYFVLVKYGLGYDKVRMTYDYGVLRGFVPFFVGMALVKIHANLRFSRVNWSYVELLVVLVALYDVLVWEASWLLNLCIPFVVLISLQGNGYICRFLKLYVWEKIGVISLSIYLWHWPLIKILSGQLGHDFFGSSFEEALFVNFAYLIVLLLISDLSYKYIEVPSRAYIRGLNLNGLRPTRRIAGFVSRKRSRGSR